MDGLTLLDTIALIRKLLSSGLTADAETKAKISTMTDEEVVAYAREICTETDKESEEFIQKFES